MATTCRTCGQANADGTEYCVRCGTRMPDPSSTQLVGTAGQGAEEYPWEPPAEWDPGDISSGAHTPPPATWVATPPPPGQEQGGWNTGPGTGGQGYPATAPAWGQQGSQPPAYPPPPPASPQGTSKKPWIIGATAVVVIGAIVAVVLVVTGGKKSGPALNGVEKQSATDALATTRQALRDAKTARISGTVSSGGQTIRFDVSLTGNDSKGTLTISNNDVQLIKIGQTVFIKGDQDFLKKYAGNNTAVLDKLNGKWLKTNSTSDFDLFTLDGFAGLLKGGTGSNAVNPTVTQDTLNGQKVAVVTQKDGSKLDIANTGPAVPLLLASKGSDGGTVTFANYNKPVSITAPPSSEVFDVNAAAGGGTLTGTLTGTYSCTGNDSSTDGGTLTLAADNSYAVSGGGIGGSWGSSGDQVAFAGGALDKYAATWNGSDTLDLKGSGTNASVSFTCTKQ